MGEMPEIGRTPWTESAGRWVAVGAIVASVGACGVMLYLRMHAPPPVPPPLPSPSILMAPPAVDPPPAPAVEARRGGPQRVTLVVSGPIETALVAKVGRAVGLPLSQVVVRELVWWLDVPQDLRKGDKLDVLYEERPGEEPYVMAVRFSSGKLARKFAAYRWKSDTARFARFFQPDGQELETRLEDGPVDDYEQVTSLLRDGRGHKGVDFKTPVGTPVKATFDGVVTRRNWNFRQNGNSLEVRESGTARTAMFLHLSDVPKELHVGDKVTRGQVVAASGNTGHSFAPHLHYQLMGSATQVLDPFTVHKTTRRKLADSDTAAFELECKRLDQLIDQPRA